MNKKIIGILVVIVIIVLLIFGYSAYNNFEKTKFGSSSVSVPTDYKVINSTNNSITLKKNHTQIVIEENNDSIGGLVEKYKAKHENETVEVKDDTVNNTTVKSLTLKDAENKTVKKIYYLERNGKVFSIIFKNYDKQAVNTILKTLE